MKSSPKNKRISPPGRRGGKVARKITRQPPASNLDDSIDAAIEADEIAVARADRNGDPFLIVAVGGGSGSAPAFTQLLAQLPSKPNIAFLFMSLSDKAPKQNKTNLLSNSSALQVVEVKDRLRINPDNIYIPTRDKVLRLTGDGSEVEAVDPTAGMNGHLRLDPMFRSVAAEARERGIGVLLSGKGSDGVLGLNDVKGEGGIVLVQDPTTAAEPEVLSKALASGVVDFTFPPKKIGDELLHLAQQIPALASAVDEGAISPKYQTQYNKIFTLLRALTSVDFSLYKPTTLKRRIQRRMVLCRISTLEEYVKYLQQNPPEVDLLFQDILINVTAFFRDPPVFQTLKKRIFPRIIDSKRRDAPIRIWVPGCSTGEEVYSIAMCLVEFLGRHTPSANIQIFATDISESALARARNGFYPDAITANVSEDRLKRFFHKNDHGYQISKFIRDMCVFARQNLFEDPPFSKLDLISCRNVLIYLGPILQKKVIPIFHYALKPTGYLLLGGSETIGQFSDLFTLMDKRHKVYQKRLVAARPEVEFTTRPILEEVAPLATQRPRTEPLQRSTPEVARHVDRILLAQYAPAGVVVNSALDVLQFRGQTGPYLEHAAGEASLNLFRLLREGLTIELRSLVSRAAKMDVVVRKEGITFRDGRQQRVVNVDVIPFKNPPSNEKFLLILFNDTSHLHAHSQAMQPASGKRASHAERENLRLRDELLTTKESLQAIIEEQEATNEELKSANEEIQSSNEELQSTNEELETAKEELQSTNEELTTLNEELQSRNTELSMVNNDLNNLLSSVNLPILMLGNDLTIRRFTPMAERFFNLIPTDVGRRIGEFNPNLEITNLDKRVTEVIESLKTQDHDVRDRDGRWFSLRIRPYRTKDNKIDGAVLILVDINEIRRSLEEITELVSQPLLLLTGDYRVHRANRAFYHTFQLDPAQSDDLPIYKLGNGEWNIPALHALLESGLPENRRVEKFRIEHEFTSIGERVLEFSARVLHQESKGTQLILLAIEDVTTNANRRA